jgi:hypothetical protein
MSNHRRGSSSGSRFGGVLERPGPALVALLVAGFAAYAAMALIGAAPARAASTRNTALILGTSVSPGGAPDASGKSVEEYEADLEGYTTTVVTGAQWDAMTAAQFAQYQVLVIGDATCPDEDGASSPAFAPAAADASTWEPVVMASGGNKVLIGTDPTYHFLNDSGPNADKLEGNGIAFAGAVAGATGAYVDLSCAFTAASPSTPVSLLDGLSSHGAGQFTVGGAPCAGAISIVAASGPTTGLHDADLSDWECSVHEYFDKYPADYTPLALATDPSVPKTYSATDIDTGATVSGSPYILVSGGGIVVTSNITLTPATQSIPAGASSTATITATVLKGGAPESGKSVTFNVNSGPNTGKTFTGTTNAAGQVVFTYTDAGGAGTDGISATFVDDLGAAEKGLATVKWTSAAAPPTAKITTPPTGTSYTYGQVVPASYTCTAGTGGTLKTCVGTVADGADIATTPLGTHTFLVTATDTDGQVGVASSSYTVKAAPPTVSIVTPPCSGVYTVGDVVDASYSCAAGAGGTLEACSGPVADGAPIDTATAGTHTFAVTATDTDGQTVAASTTYTVNKAPTQLTAPPLVLQVLPGNRLAVFEVEATLTYGAHHLALPGKTVTFTAGSTALCSGVTNAAGLASCNYDLGGLLGSVFAPLFYEASFAGDGNYLASSATAPVVQLLGIGLL